MLCLLYMLLCALYALVAPGSRAALKPKVKPPGLAESAVPGKAEPKAVDHTNKSRVDPTAKGTKPLLRGVGPNGKIKRWASTPEDRVLQAKSVGKEGSLRYCKGCNRQDFWRYMARLYSRNDADWALRNTGRLDEVGAAGNQKPSRSTRTGA